MKFNHELELAFIKAIQKRPALRTIKDLEAIKFRNKHINKQFRHTSDINFRLVLFNDKLRELEQQTFSQYRQLDHAAAKMVGAREIDDYNITLLINFWNSHFNGYDPDMEGNPFYETADNFMLHQHLATYDPAPHNDQHLKAPMPFIKHCYSFHALYDHSDLTWFDIYNIADVWMEIKIDYQLTKSI